ncbi:MAG: hypothetical protein ACNI25_03325 [Halarcobacter sp.]
MSYKKWIFLFFILNILSVLIIEILYRIYYVEYRHNVDYLVKKTIPSLKNENKEVLILGDSVANGAFKNLILKDNVLDLTSNRAISIAGNYFLLKRYLKQNNIPKKVYLFVIPEFFQNDLNEPYTYLFFETVFTEKEEINEIKKLKPTLYNSNHVIDKYFERRIKGLFKEDKYKAVKRDSFIDIDETKIYNDFINLNDNVLNRINSYKKSLNKLEKLSTVYLSKLKTLCLKNNIEFNIVIEPVPIEIQKLFYNSKIYNYLNLNNYRIIDVNDYYKFGNNHFIKDSIHFSGNINNLFQKIIDKNIIDIF